MTDVITRHGRNGAVLFVSPAAEPLFGAKVSELHGHGLFDRVHVADRPAYLTALADAAALRRGALGRIPRAARSATESGAPPRGRSSSGSRCAAGRSISASGEAERAARWSRSCATSPSARCRSRRSRRRAPRPSAPTPPRSKFLATMSHELRTPLNAIIGFSEMLMNEEQMRLDAARRHEYAQLINDSGTHLLSVVNGILDMSKIETGDFEITPEPFAPAQVIGNCCDLLALKAREAGLELVDAAAARPAGDRRRQARVQADHAQPAFQRGQVHRPRRPGDGRARRSRPAASWSTVEDTGVGISAEDLPRVGHPFFQARARLRPPPRRHRARPFDRARAWSRCTAARWTSRAGWARARASRVRLPLDCEAVRPARKPSNVAHPSFDRVAEAAEALIKKTA